MKRYLRVCASSKVRAGNKYMHLSYQKKRALQAAAETECRSRSLAERGGSAH